MRAGSLVAGRARWAAVATALTLTGGLFLVTHGALAGVVASAAAPGGAVSPTVVRLGDAVQFGQPVLASAADASSATYAWNFGDGTVGLGPQVEHRYSAPGQYAVTLTVTGPSAAPSTVTQVVQVRRTAHLPMRADMAKSNATGTAPDAGLTVGLQLLPQALHAVLNRGLALQVSSTAPANGFASISLARRFAKLAQIKSQGKAWVLIGTGTVWQVKAGTVTLHLHLASSVVSKLKHLTHAALSVKLSLVDAHGRRVAVDAAGRY